MKEIILDGVGSLIDDLINLFGGIEKVQKKPLAFLFFTMGVFTIIAIATGSLLNL